jgi:DNA sulfur modification protein DndC
MKASQSSFFDGGQRLQMTESIELTIQSLQAYGPITQALGHRLVGGKDSAAPRSR